MLRHSGGSDLDQRNLILHLELSQIVAFYALLKSLVRSLEGNHWLLFHTKANAVTMVVEICLATEEEEEELVGR